MSIKDMLTWKVTEVQGDNAEFQVVSSPIDQAHLVVWPVPDPHNPPREIELQHEYTHALLAETVHHLFSGHIFKRGTPPQQIREVAWACRSATDWFVDHQLIKFKEDLLGTFYAELREHLEYVNYLLDGKKAAPSGVLFGSGLIIAQACKYLDADVPGNRRWFVVWLWLFSMLILTNLH